MSENLELAVKQTTDAIRRSLDGPTDLVFVFAAGYAPEEFDRHLVTIRKKLNAVNVIGCTCESVIGGDVELEAQTALSIWAARLPGSDIVPMHLEFVRSAQESAIVGWPPSTNGDWPDDSVMIVLGEPFEFPVDVLLDRFNEDRPGIRIAGGLVSGAQIPGEARLLLNEETFSAGLVAVRISNVKTRMFVSQGCRPIGDSMVITSAERNIIQTLGGKPALDQVESLFQTLPTHEQRMVQDGLHLGRVINEYQDSFGFGDFLIRNVIAVDQQLRSISIEDYVRPGQTVRFHVRDGESASIELNQFVENALKQQKYQSALLFTCNGRGLNLFPEPHHDAAAICTGDKIPLAGFFAGGEIGPVGNQNFLHGFTASLVLFD